MTTPNKTPKELVMNENKRPKIEPTKTLNFNREIEVGDGQTQEGTFEVNRKFLERLIVDNISVFNKRYLTHRSYNPILIPNDWELSQDDFDLFNPTVISLEYMCVSCDEYMYGYYSEDETLKVDEKDIKDRLTNVLFDYLGKNSTCKITKDICMERNTYGR
jgi:hypothetical protein